MMHHSLHYVQSRSSWMISKNSHSACSIVILISMRLPPARCMLLLFIILRGSNFFDRLVDDFTGQITGYQPPIGASFIRWAKGSDLLDYHGCLRSDFGNRDRGDGKPPPLPHHRACGSAPGGSVKYDEVDIAF